MPVSKYIRNVNFPIPSTTGVEGFDVGTVQAFRLRTEPVANGKALRIYVDHESDEGGKIDLERFNMWHVYRGQSDDVHKAFVWDQEKKALGNSAPDSHYYQKFVKKIGGARVEEIHFQSKKLESVP